jgi:plasmid maintenance system antidote protein VapI
MTLEQRLRDAIKQSGWSATALSKLVPIPQPMISRFIRGHGLTLRTAQHLADHFGLELHQVATCRTSD